MGEAVSIAIDCIVKFPRKATLREIQLVEKHDDFVRDRFLNSIAVRGSGKFTSNTGTVIHFCTDKISMEA